MKIVPKILNSESNVFAYYEMGMYGLLSLNSIHCPNIVLGLFRFKSQEQLTTFLSRNFQNFQDLRGVILPTVGTFHDFSRLFKVITFKTFKI